MMHFSFKCVWLFWLGFLHVCSHKTKLHLFFPGFYFVDVTHASNNIPGGKAIAGGVAESKTAVNVSCKIKVNLF